MKKNKKSFLLELMALNIVAITIVLIILLIAFGSYIWGAIGSKDMNTPDNLDASEAEMETDILN